MKQKHIFSLLIASLASMHLFSARPSPIGDLYSFDDVGFLPAIDHLAYAKAFEWLIPLFTEKLLSLPPSTDFSTISRDGIIIKTHKDANSDTVGLFSPLYSVHFNNARHKPNPLLQETLSLLIAFEKLSIGTQSTSLYSITVIQSPLEQIKIAFMCPCCQEKDLIITDTNPITLQARKDLVTRCKEDLNNENKKELISQLLIFRAIEIQTQAEKRKEKQRQAFAGEPIQVDQTSLAEMQEEMMAQSILAKSYSDLKQSARDLFRVSSDLFERYLHGSQESNAMTAVPPALDDDWITIENVVE